MSQYRIHVLYEYGHDLRPFGSAQIRLLRPLAHPRLRDCLEVSAGWKYSGQSVDAVIVDRLWRPDITVALAHSLVNGIRRNGARLLYALDDDLLNMPARYAGLSREDCCAIAELFLREADGVIVTTPQLKQMFSPFNENCVVVPNSLDERLIGGGKPSPVDSPFGQRRKVIGYMGTMTHDADLQLLLPAWQAIHKRYGSEIEFQIAGVTSRPQTLHDSNLPIRIMAPHPAEVEYPLFMLWFTGQLCWDIAVSPLQDTTFNRCKSDIKFLDYSALGTAGVYSDVRAYQSSVSHMKTGWLADNTVAAWVAALDRLLVDDLLRQKIATSAKRYLYTHRVLKHTVPRWLHVLERLMT